MNYLDEIRKNGDNNTYIENLFNDMKTGKIKMFLMYKALQTRNHYQELYRNGEYIPLETGGQFKNNIIAFARKTNKTWAITVVPRFLTGIIKENNLPLGIGTWQDTHILIPSPIKPKNLITMENLSYNRIISVGDIFRQFPAAIIFGEE